MYYSVTPILSKILKERNITQSEFAEITGISQATISRFDRSSQHLDMHLVIISRALDLSIEDLFTIIEQGWIDDDGQVYHGVKKISEIKKDNK